MVKKHGNGDCSDTGYSKGLYWAKQVKGWERADTIRENIRHYGSEDLAFRGLLGGIGTGNVSLDGAGRLCDFEMMNQPDKGNKIPYTFFAIWAEIGEEKPRALVVEAKHRGISDRALGHPSGELYGLPRFDRSRVEVQYPFYRYTFEKKGLPLLVSMEAYTPFVPLNSIHSGIPGARFAFRVKNEGNRTARVSLCGSMYNVTGMTEYDGYDRLYQDGKPVNRFFSEAGINGISFENEMPESALTFGSLCLATANRDYTVKPCWQFGGWWDGAEEFWQDFARDGRLNEACQSEAVGSNVVAAAQNRYVGSLAAMEEIMPGETKEFVFYLTWYFPNRPGWWPDGHKRKEEQKSDRVFRNYYSTIWKDALDCACYMKKKEEELERTSRTFSAALYSSTLTPEVVECLVSAITVLRSTTCFRIEDGSFFGWEGCFEHAGSCAGTCTHVWNYAQAMAFLFPELEQSARKTEFLTETDEEGNMAFRAKRLLSGEKWDMLPAADGQLGSIMRVYREWKLSGDSDFLELLWEKVKLALNYGIRIWDQDQDGVLEAMQHNTYDIEFYGVNSLCCSLFYGALLAGAEMAEHMGDKQSAKAWRGLADKGSKKMDQLLFNGSYYRQGMEEEQLDAYKYQYGNGCLSDQLLGQSLAHLYGLSYLFPKEHVKQAVKAIYDYNFKPSLEGHESVQRTYAFEEEGGLLLCTWPFGGRPRQPFVYSDEVWTGIEYQVATHLIYEGYTEEALEMIRTLRARYDGTCRSPMNELECGNHYARSMAAWGLLVALSGYRFDLVRGKISFEPVIHSEDFTCFYSNAGEWGVYRKWTEDGEGKEEICPLYRVIKAESETMKGDGSEREEMRGDSYEV